MAQLLKRAKEEGMTVATLERKPIVLPDSGVSQEIADLAKDAERYLDYSGLAQRVSQTDRQLDRVLAELAIVPYTAESVEAYKRSLLWVKREEQLIGLSRFRRFLSKYSDKLFGSGSLSAMGGGLVSILAASEGSFLLTNIMGIVAFLGFVALIFTAMFSKIIQEYSWERTGIDKYDLPVPESVLRKAIQIKSKLPQVDVSIEHLTDKVADPFLVVSHAGSERYIEVWDEPGFETKILSQG